MYKAERALDERMEYSQLAPSRWRATYRGFVTLSAEGLDPKNAQFNLDEAFDLLLANLIRTSHRPLKSDPNFVVHDTEEPATTNMVYSPPSPDKSSPQDKPGQPGVADAKKPLPFRRRG